MEDQFVLRIDQMECSGEHGLSERAGMLGRGASDVSRHKRNIHPSTNLGFLQPLWRLAGLCHGRDAVALGVKLEPLGLVLAPAFDRVLHGGEDERAEVVGKELQRTQQCLAISEERLVKPRVGGVEWGWRCVSGGGRVGLPRVKARGQPSVSTKKRRSCCLSGVRHVLSQGHEARVYLLGRVVLRKLRVQLGLVRC